MPVPTVLFLLLLSHVVGQLTAGLFTLISFPSDDPLQKRSPCRTSSPVIMNRSSTWIAILRVAVGASPPIGEVCVVAHFKVNFPLTEWFALLSLGNIDTNLETTLRLLWPTETMANTRRPMSRRWDVAVDILVAMQRLLSTRSPLTAYPSSPILSSLRFECGGDRQFFQWYLRSLGRRNVALPHFEQACTVDEWTFW